MTTCQTSLASVFASREHFLDIYQKSIRTVCFLSFTQIHIRRIERIIISTVIVLSNEISRL